VFMQLVNLKPSILKTLLLLVTLFISFTLQANDEQNSPQNKADLAVANILFEYSIGEEEYASYRTDDDGYAYVTFAENIPDKLFNQILTTMQEHPDIRDVIFDKGGPSCKLW